MQLILLMVLGINIDFQFLNSGNSCGGTMGVPPYLAVWVRVSEP